MGLGAGAGHEARALLSFVDRARVVIPRPAPRTVRRFAAARSEAVIVALVLLVARDGARALANARVLGFVNELEPGAALAVERFAAVQRFALDVAQPASGRLALVRDDDAFLIEAARLGKTAPDGAVSAKLGA